MSAYQNDQGDGNTPPGGRVENIYNVFQSPRMEAPLEDPSMRQTSNSSVPSWFYSALSPELDKSRRSILEELKDHINDIASSVFEEKLALIEMAIRDMNGTAAMLHDVAERNPKTDPYVHLLLKFFHTVLQNRFTELKTSVIDLQKAMQRAHDRNMEDIKLELRHLWSNNDPTITPGADESRSTTTTSPIKGPRQTETRGDTEFPVPSKDNLEGWDFVGAGYASNDRKG
ncbi:hypothetical protein AAE478_010297 [Parahypoxylon ruwenzoriense]